ncbi:AMP-binding protein [Gymnodinialimonas sp. 2305UL16-5]|uniref:class I adenylate-forming enzyme family protein n=1 Tax=Gymnodinialimonas mytili TaxID=3126503 RepID=UPI003094C602
MNIAEWLSRVAATRGAAPALLLGAEVVSDYAGFAAASAKLAGGLKSRGIGPGDRVGIFAQNCPDYLVTLFGIWWAGAIAVPINAKLHPKEAAWILADAGATLCFTGDGKEARNAVPFGSISGTAARVADCARDDVAWLFYTSGTTGKPKGVQITHGMLAAASLCYPVDVDPVRPEDAALYAAPMSHGAGVYAPIHVRMGARHISPRSAGFDPGEVLELSERLGPTSMFMAPTMVRRLVDTAKAQGRSGAGIKTVVYGGGPMYRADIEEAVAVLGPRFVQIYGQGECPMTITALSRNEVADRSHPRWAERLQSVGRAQSCVEVAVDAPTGEVGEIMVKGAAVMPGYWNNPEATAKALQDGWLRTGDVGWLDPDGYLTLQDRSKDVIISGGSNIYTREVEEALLTHPSVHEVSVVGRASEEWGEDVVAFVVCRPGQDLDEAALDTHCLDQIARFKRPKAYFPVQELPKNNYGKVLKTRLREMLS